TPQVDEGRYPAKRTVGETVVVEADVYADGHDEITALLLWRKAGEADWNETPMAPLGNDRWRAALSKKVGAGQDVSSELLEGALIVRAAAARARAAQKTALSKLAAALEDTAVEPPQRLVAALSEDLRARMARHAD